MHVRCATACARRVRRVALASALAHIGAVSQTAGDVIAGWVGLVCVCIASMRGMACVSEL